MGTSQFLETDIDKMLFEEFNNNSVLSEYFIQKGIDPKNFLGKAEVALAKEINEEEVWLKKLIYDSIIAKTSHDLAHHERLKEEILEYCDVTENQALLNKYIDLLIKFGV